MSWRLTAFNASTTEAQAVALAAPILTGADASLADASARVQGVSLAYSPNPLATQASEAAAAREAYQALMHYEGQILCVHPFQEGVADGSGLYRYLSAPNAAARLAAKLTDAQDAGRPLGQLDAVALLIVARDLAGFAERLAAFNAVFPAPELQLAQRRAAQLATLEQEKWLLPDAPLTPPWVARDGLQIPRLAQHGRAVGAQLATAQGYAAETPSPIAELQAVIERKRQHLQQLQSHYDQLKSQLTGQAGYALYAEGDASAVAAQLQAGAPGHEYVLTAGALFVADAGRLTFLKETFGL
ncbi:hypothetical protein EUZ85_29775 [Hahella sp. KA22]|uniref:hypothetical protein n=1 Tax=Hahella sp. KA22 TaxID=1628392 RepID=UPI000FDD9377|nr:hypothetical protein [Hahella sp. KA22]AZZ94674.1 hypothetical protein ENC22_27190 [Hahella sp. KA22]QAY58047.1 hypothetical protein EUZ85_29775 [Hahella sp. KA22]